MSAALSSFLRQLSVASCGFVAHDSAEIETAFERIGTGTRIWRWVHVCNGVEIGENCSIGQGCYIGPNVRIGNNVRIQNGAFIPELVTIEDDVFIGPNVVFTNDKHPPGKREDWLPILVKRGASIGANATIIAGVTIHEGARVGAGAVVTKDVVANELVKGVPAK